MAIVYDREPQVEGDSLRPMILSIQRMDGDNVVTLVGATVTFTVFRSKTSKIYLQKDSAGQGGVNILDPVECLIEILGVDDPQLTAADYFYSVTIEYADGSIRTYLGGKLPIQQYLGVELQS